MIFGSCLLLLADEEDPIGEKYIGSVKKAGYDYLEIPLCRLMNSGDAKCMDFVAEVRKSGIPVKAYNNCLPRNIVHFGDDTDQGMLNEYMDKALYLNRLFGGDIMNVIGPIKSAENDKISEERVMDRYLSFLDEYAGKAGKQGTALYIEPINSEENGMIDSVEKAIACIDRLQRDNIGVVVDFYHFFKAGDSYEYLLKHTDYIKHVHYATADKRQYPAASDIEEMKRVLCPLVHAGYQKSISIEARTPDPERDLPASLRLMKSILAVE